MKWAREAAYRTRLLQKRASAVTITPNVRAKSGFHTTTVQIALHCGTGTSSATTTATTTSSHSSTIFSNSFFCLCRSSST